VTGFADGAQLMRASYDVVRRRPGLLSYPVVSTLCLALTAGFWIYQGWWLHLVGGPPVLIVPIAALAIYTLVFIGIFFNVALAGAADTALNGEEPTFGDGIELAWARLGSIAAWAAYSTFVSALLGMVEGIKGLRWVGKAAEVAWNFATLFVIPLIAIEGAEAGDARRRSFQLARADWQAESSGLTALRAAIFVPALLFALDGKLLFGGHAHSGPAKLLLGVLFVLGCGVLVFASVVRQVFAVELYRSTGAAA
jgi:hypothetical protein